MKTFHEFIQEKVFQKSPYIIHRNPGWREIQKILDKSSLGIASIRFMIESENETYYAWDANKAIHIQAAEAILGKRLFGSFTNFRFKYELMRSDFDPDDLFLASDSSIPDLKKLMRTTLYKRMIKPSGKKIRLD